MLNIFNIKQKVIVISGATGILGSALAKYLALNGAKVIILGRNPKKVSKLVSNINDEGGEAFAVVADVTQESQLKSACEVIDKEFGIINILINAAGGNMPGAVVMPDQDIMTSDSKALQQVMELNYMGTFLPTKILLPLLLKNNEGSIINISSMAASRPLTRVMGYASAKAAIDNLTKWLSTEFAKKYGEGIRVNAIAPGFFLTEQNRTLLTNKDGSLTERGQKIIESTPMGRFGYPDELFGAAHWLCSDASKFVTGTIIPVDGGFSAYAGV